MWEGVEKFCHSFSRYLKEDDNLALEQREAFIKNFLIEIIQNYFSKVGKLSMSVHYILL